MRTLDFAPCKLADMSSFQVSLKNLLSSNCHLSSLAPALHRPQGLFYLQLKGVARTSTTGLWLGEEKDLAYVLGASRLLVLPQPGDGECLNMSLSIPAHLLSFQGPEGPFHEAAHTLTCPTLHFLFQLPYLLSLYPQR